MSKKFKNVYQFKITLKGIKPPIWRRILVPDNITFADFSEILNSAMGWLGYHLHSFYVVEPRSGLEFELSDYETVLESDNPLCLDEAKIIISEYFSDTNKKAKYTYDFGDDWEHNLTLEKILPRNPDIEYPVCIKGKRACPPEDVGGVWRYQEFLEIIKDPDHPEHEEMLEWVGGEFDPEKFEL